MDQVQCMAGQLNLDTMERRIVACLTFEQETLRSGVWVEALRPLHCLFLSGQDIERGEFKRMTGLGDRTAVTLIGLMPRPIRGGAAADARRASPNLTRLCASDALTDQLIPDGFKAPSAAPAP